MTDDAPNFVEMKEELLDGADSIVTFTRGLAKSNPRIAVGMLLFAIVGLAKGMGLTMPGYLALCQMAWQSMQRRPETEN